MYDYLWTYTAAQIELMNVDAPFVAYKKRDKSEETKPSGGGEPTRETCDETVRKWKERRKKRKINLEDFLGKIPNGESSEVNNNNNTD